MAWSSSDETVAVVSPNGRVTALKLGSAVITATSQDGSHTAQCTVTVSKVVFGDVNRDDRVDALLALQHSVKLIEFFRSKALSDF